MNARAHTLWAVHRSLWGEAIRAAWNARHRLVLASLLMWVPWRVLVPVLDRWWGVEPRIGIPLAWVADAFYEPFYGAVVLVMLSGASVAVRRILVRSLWLLPRFWLINFKVAVWGAAAPYLVLHLGSAAVLSVWQSTSASRGIIAATVVAMTWVVVVAVRYLLAPTVMVAEQEAEGWRLRGDGPVHTARLWFGGLSTGWTLWAARRLLRGQVRQAVLVLLVGQGAVSLVQMLVPPGEHLIIRIADGAMMTVTALWWSLLWAFCRHCIRARGTG